LRALLGQAGIQSGLFCDYRTNFDTYPNWPACKREKRPHLLVDMAADQIGELVRVSSHSRRKFVKL
jgi:hypothetical protein